MQEQVERSQKTVDMAQQDLTYKSRDFSNFRSRSRGRRRGVGRGNFGSVHNDIDKSSKGSKDDTKESKDEDPRTNDPIICHYCSQPNHIATYCFKKFQDRRKQRAGNDKESSN